MRDIYEVVDRDSSSGRGSEGRSSRARLKWWTVERVWRRREEGAEEETGEGKGLVGRVHCHCCTAAGVKRLVGDLVFRGRCFSGEGRGSGALLTG